MPRNMSFMLTTEQIRNRTKTVTRRLGWWNIKDGEIINACVKCQGLKKGEKIEHICLIRIIGHRPEPLWLIDEEDLAREGFSHLSTWEFIDMFCKHNKCEMITRVNRIQFEYV